MQFPNLIDKRIGDRVRSRRISLDMSQQTLAQALATTIQQVQNWEAGVSRIGAARLVELSSILEVSPIFFFADEQSAELNGEAGPKEAARSQSVFGSSPPSQMVRLLRAFANMSKD